MLRTSGETHGQRRLWENAQDAGGGVWPQEKTPQTTAGPSQRSQYRLTLASTAEIPTAAVHTPFATAATEAGRPALTPPPAPQTTSKPSTFKIYHLSFTPFRSNL